MNAEDAARKIQALEETLWRANAKRAVCEATTFELLSRLFSSRPGGPLLGFGDGYSETVEVKAVGVASTELGVAGPNAMKRELLIGLGADVIVPDYREQASLVEWLWRE